MNIDFPPDFPNIEQLFELIGKTNEKSWKNELSVELIQKWLQNFKGEVYSECDEQRLALWLLYNFTYYSSKEVNHLCHILFYRFIHALISNSENPINEKEINDEIANLQFAAIGQASESGGMLLYHFRQESGLGIERFFHYTEISYDENAVIVFIDDVTLSGSTAERFYKNKIKGKKYKQIYYITIMASEEAITKISKLGITVVYTVLIDKRNRAFDNDSILFNRFPSLCEAAERIAVHYGEQIVEPYDRVEPLGYENGEYCFGFYYNTPNNTLPIFWSEHKWTPIFTRKEKLRNVNDIIRGTEQFI